MALRIYNTRTRRKAAFRSAGPVRMYVCGPTVYAPSHMGHARSYVAFDVVRRYLEFLGHPVRYVVNITDVEDTITNRARERRERPLAMAARYAREFLEDMAALGVKPADANPRVSEHVPDIVAVGKDLVAAGKAYVADRSVYLDTGDGGAFGPLSHVDVREALADDAPAGPRRHPLDFAIWRRPKPRGLAWGSPWGPGTPGWHIECYAMARKHLGEVDIHGGGRDLIYPHHESENAISRAHAGADYAKVWMHNGWLTLETEKMSKSLGNVVPLRDVLAAYPGDVVRLCLAKVHYREDVEYDRDCFTKTAKELETIRGAVAHASGVATAKRSNPAVRKLVDRTRAKFLAAMDNDFDTNTAFYALLQFAEALNGVRRISRSDRDHMIAAVGDLGRIFGIGFDRPVRVPVSRPLRSSS
ncbi:MAG TPA: cysteine--tRNA ligase [Thermoplasmata archaeon]|nr:cysteine--tRNA ligase [Thermoplasmata archaeon]